MSLTVLSIVKALAMLCVAVSIALAFAMAVFAPDTLARRLLFRYVATLEKRMRLMFIETRGMHVVIAQALAMLAALGLALGVNKLFAVLVPVVAVAPVAMLERMRKKRVQRIEQVLDGFVLALANAMRATPSAGKALATIQGVTPAPLDREIELVLR